MNVIVDKFKDKAYDDMGKTGRYNDQETCKAYVRIVQTDIPDHITYTTVIFTNDVVLICKPSNHDKVGRFWFIESNFD